MHQKGFKEILPKKPICGLKGLLGTVMGLLGSARVCHGSVMGPLWVRIIFPTILFWQITKLYYLLLIIN